MLAEGALQRVRSCCGHTSGEHVARFADPVRGTGLSHYCGRCRTTCDGASTMTRASSAGSPWGSFSSFVKPAPAPGSVNSRGSVPPRSVTTAGRPSHRSPFGDLIASLERGPVATG